MIGKLCLAVNGLLYGMYGYFFMTNPMALLGKFFGPQSPQHFVVGDIFLEETFKGICRYFGVAQLTFSFLFFHYIPFEDKRGPGLRLALMLAIGNIAVVRLSSPPCPFCK